uniref:Uncharacterized protein n=1 Tax=Magnetococcus massalia (strain MO-1) TaxID=451514 RepID=A0A1S7LLK8_MAGMO|nr:conserved protein of unknown function [Candidatus Magnetococcus massalia]
MTPARTARIETLRGMVNSLYNQCSAPCVPSQWHACYPWMQHASNRICEPIRSIMDGVIGGGRMGDRDKEVEKEILSQQKFTMAGAIGRAAGGGVMRGASPVSRQKQAINHIEAYIRNNCPDPSGALNSVLARRVKNSTPTVEKQLEQPLLALAEIIQTILASESALFEFVRQVDLHWGEMYQERPHFQQPGQTPHSEDEYTHNSVRESLLALLEKTKTSNQAKMP